MGIARRTHDLRREEVWAAGRTKRAPKMCPKTPNLEQWTKSPRDIEIPRELPGTSEDLQDPSRVPLHPETTEHLRKLSATRPRKTDDDVDVAAFTVAVPLPSTHCVACARLFLVAPAFQ